MLPPKEQMEQFRQQQKNRFQEAEESPIDMRPQAVSGFGPPQFEVHDDDQLEQDYANFGLEEPLLQEEDTESVDESIDESDFTPPSQWNNRQDYPTPPTMKQAGNAFLRDDVIFEGGPTRSELMSWKKQFEVDGHHVCLTEHAGETFIWRTLSRVEYREVMSLQNIDPLQREEILCEICMLFPYDYNFSSMASKKAGVPAVLAEQIMQESGFQRPTPPIRL